MVLMQLPSPPTRPAAARNLARLAERRSALVEKTFFATDLVAD
jgi:hypothetical protein